MVLALCQSCRLRRATSIETILFESVTVKQNKGDRDQPRLNLIGRTGQPGQARSFLEPEGQHKTSEINEPEVNGKNDAGECFLRLAALPTFPLDRLNRYEYILWRQARQLVLTLETLRRRPGRERLSFFRRRLETRNDIPQGLKSPLS